MYRGFDLTLSLAKNATSSRWEKIGRDHYEEKKDQIRNDLDSYLMPNGLLDGSQLIRNWFPTVSADVFISHSHDDEKLAVTFAGFLLDKFEITSFIDSSIWGYSNDLLWAIDVDFSLSEVDGAMFDYNKRNFSTAHIHMMLNTALNQMIDKTECLFFLNTSNSISTKDAVKLKTKSPWIYSEMVMSELIRRKTRDEHRDTFKSKSFSEGIGMINERSLGVEYDLYLGHLEKIKNVDLEAWDRAYQAQKRKPLYPLDTLYNLHNNILHG